MRSLFLLFALGLAACNPHPMGQSQPKTIPDVTIEGEDEHNDLKNGHMQLTAENDFFLYHFKVRPAVLASLRAGLIKDPTALRQKNNRVIFALKNCRKAINANDFEKWRVWHARAYLGMAQMLDEVKTGAPNAK